MKQNHFKLGQKVKYIGTSQPFFHNKALTVVHTSMICHNKITKDKTQSCMCKYDEGYWSFLSNHLEAEI